MKKSKIQIFLRDLASDFRWSQLFVVICLMFLSILFVYSATNQGGSQIPPQVRQQSIWFTMGLICYFLISLIDYHWICRQCWLFYLIILALLIYVLKYGKLIYGARRWITFYGFNLQPSEFAKLSIMITLCYYLSRSMGLLNDWRRLGFVSILAIVPAILINKEPDLGTALVVIALFLVLLFLAEVPMRFFLILGIITTLGLSVVSYETYRYITFRQERAAGKIASDKFKSIFHLKEYQLDRIVGVIAPQELDPLGAGWNLKQSQIAIGSGKLYGKGWNKGDVTHGGYLPRTVALNDFIFAVFAEEMGFVGGVLLTGLYAILLFGGIKIAMKARDSLGTLLASGVTFLIFFHVFVNMGMTMGILPIVGVPLPLMSNGGSFVLVCMISLGLLQSVWLHRKPY